jgi:SAM-dependent MidA family methyltransferase
MKASKRIPALPALAAALRERAAGAAAVSFADFMDVALYGRGVGYYRCERRRVGRQEGTDFFTASSSPLFGPLVVESCVQLLGRAAASEHEFVEIGSEPSGGILTGIKHPFRAYRQVRLGDPLRIEGRSVVFSNELFDAQPFRRFRYREGTWRELGVSLETDVLEETELGAARLALLPDGAGEGYVIDAPLAASELARSLAAQPWTGLFLAFDYGKSWEELCHSHPEGTARAYRHHAQSCDLLAFPGEQDLTCHLCWDWISTALSERGFAAPTLESQEAFFVRHGAALLARTAQAEAGRLSRDKLSLMQLLHPAHMGQKFQALWAMRSTSGGGPPVRIPLPTACAGR